MVPYDPVHTTHNIDYTLINARQAKINILAVEDDPLSMGFIEANISELGHNIIKAENGAEAVEILEKKGAFIDVVLMDRLMPVMDGLSAIYQIKRNPELRGIPIIMVTGADAPEEMKEGLEAGVFYYLTKPVDQSMLRSVLTAAVKEAEQTRTLAEELDKHRKSFHLVETCKFKFRTLNEAESLSAFIANFYPDPHRVLSGIGELLINALEHGNLGIGYTLKTQLIENGTWRAEIERLQTMPQHTGKSISVTLAHKDDGTYIVIEDQGNGFDWRKYMHIDPARAGDILEASIPINKGELLWIYRPTEDFMRQYTSNTALIMFAVLATLSIAITFLSMLLRSIVKMQAERDKAKEISLLKSDFLATMSHEIRTPMNGILGMAELIINSSTNVQINSFAQTIINSGESLQHIIDDILDFSKIEANKMELDINPVNMLELADDVAVLYATQARDKALELVLRYVPGSEQFVMADAVRIRQILGNLLSNAIKFTDKGYIALTIREVKTPTDADHMTSLLFEIKDTGIGMDMATINNAFEKFTQADNTTTRKYGGTGLGLSICKSLIELMHGQLKVESAPLQGSTFTVTIPFERNSTLPRLQAKPPILKGVKAIVVDDLPIMRKVVTEQLINAGMRIDSASSGEEALRMIKEAQDKGQPYQIGIIDYLMPEMNGEMLASAIYDNPAFREMCLIMLSAAGNPVASQHFAEKGFSAYIAKPVRNVVFIQSLAVVWEQYNSGNRNNLIRLDTQGFVNKKSSKANTNLENKKILVAEDNLVNQVFIREILDIMHAQYFIVSNGVEAFQDYKSHDFDLIIMDCLMPEMDGFEATELIRQYEREAQKTPIPILALTANAMKGDRERCLDAGMSDYLPKPVRKDELIDKISSLLKNNNSIKPARIGSNNDDTKTTTDYNIPDDHNVINFQVVQIARETLKDKYPDILKLYLETTQGQIKDISSAFDADQIESIIRPAHTLKSTSRQMGAPVLANYAFEIEVAAKTYCKLPPDDPNFTKNFNNDIETIRMLLEDIQKTFDETREALTRMAA